MEKITGLVDDWLRRHLLISHHFVSETQDVTHMEFDCDIIFSTREAFTQLLSVCCFVFFDV